MIDRRHWLVAGAAALAGPPALAHPATTMIWSGFPPGGLGDQAMRPLLERL